MDLISPSGRILLDPFQSGTNHNFMWRGNFDGMFEQYLMEEIQLGRPVFAITKNTDFVHALGLPLADKEVILKARVGDRYDSYPTKAGDVWVTLPSPCAVMCDGVTPAQVLKAVIMSLGMLKTKKATVLLHRPESWDWGQQDQATDDLQDALRFIRKFGGSTLSMLGAESDDHITSTLLANTALRLERQKSPVTDDYDLHLTINENQHPARFFAEKRHPIAGSS